MLNPANVLGWFKAIKNQNLHRISNVIWEHLKDVFYKTQKILKPKS